VPLSGTQPPVLVQALVAALAALLRQTEADVGAALGP
jgi:hypothetical protein